MNKLSDIKKRTYTGYIWMSDQAKPRILNQEEFDFNSVDINPFIIEALLFCSEENVSVTIRHADDYVISEFDLNNLPAGSELKEVAYLPHRLDGVEKVNFKQLWIPEKDENCKGMEVLQLKALVFTGFKLKS